MMIQGEDDVLPSSFCWQTLQAQSQVVNQKLLNGFVDIAVPYFDNGGRRMVMFDNRLYLVSIVEFLHRSHVDRGTKGSRVVVGTDLSKQKVHTAPSSNSTALPHSAVKMSSSC
jgi:hypothetical protein